MGMGSHITGWSRPMICGSNSWKNVLKAGKVLKKRRKSTRDQWGILSSVFIKKQNLYKEIYICMH